MGDFLDVLAAAAKRNVDSGYYDVEPRIPYTTASRLSFRKAIEECRGNAVISEIKFSSPSSGILRMRGCVREISREMAEGGATGISVLTEPSHFSGSIGDLVEARLSVDKPLLMKDIVVSLRQIDAAYNAGANAVLLILPLFERGYCEYSLHETIEYTHSRGLEVLLETHTAEEFRKALSTEADMIGINNRNLKTLRVDIHTTKQILEKFDRSTVDGRIIVSESGIETPGDILFLKESGVHAFLVGSAVMKSANIKEFVSNLVNADRRNTVFEETCRYVKRRSRTHRRPKV